jgi:hypothetical protein
MRAQLSDVSQPCCCVVRSLISVHCLSSHFVTFLNKISEMVSPTMKSKASVKTGFINRLIVNRRFVEAVSVGKVGMTAVDE